MLVSVQIEGLAQVAQYFFCHVPRLGGVRVVTQVFQHDDELVTPQPRHGIGLANTVRQTRGDFLQQQVAPVVAQSVVEDFEVVQVNEHQRTLALKPGAQGQHMLQPVQQQLPVGQLGQWIAEGQMVNLVLCRLA